MQNKQNCMTQHQKRVNIVEILYQYFLQQKTAQEFEEYLLSNQITNENQIQTIKEILWYQDSLVKEIEKYLKSSWSFKNLKPIEKAILILATYEILHTNTQKAIIINEAIIISKQYCDKNTYKYINGVLDKINK